MRFGGKCNEYFLKCKIFDDYFMFYILLFSSCGFLVCYINRIVLFLRNKKALHQICKNLRNLWHKEHIHNCGR